MNSGQILFDTNVVSYLMKGKHLAAAYAPHLQGQLRRLPLSPLANCTTGRIMQIGASRDERNWKQPCETLWLFLMTMKLRVVTDGLCRGNGSKVEALRRMMHGLPHAPFDTVSLW